MDNAYINEPMIAIYIFETSQMLESLEQLMIKSEINNTFEAEDINEIFRFTHTIKGSSAMMMFDSISTLAHNIEDVFFKIRDNENINYDFSLLVDLVLESIDFFKIELIKVKNKEPVDGDSTELTNRILELLDSINTEDGSETKRPETEKPQKFYIRSDETSSSHDKYLAKIFFEKDCGMENIRAYTIIHNIQDLVAEIYYWPKDVIDNDETAAYITANGVELLLSAKTNDDSIKTYLEDTIFLEKLELNKITEEEYKKYKIKFNEDESDVSIKIPEVSKKYKETPIKNNDIATISTNKSIISVNVDKLDTLMDMVGELVIAEAIVTQNPVLIALEIESFEKSSRLLHKITGELQDLVMAIRMVPLSTTFMKMHRIVRDMSKKLNKRVALNVIGEETEVDKNIIEKISDPLMHIIRNAIDHGLESEDERERLGKDLEGTIKLEAKNSGSDVLVIIRDDGKGLDKDSIYNKAIEQNIINVEKEYLSDREIYNLILAPGFSTKEDVTEFSGRGVGMDVVSKNIQDIGGTVLIDSVLGEGTTIILKIPLTLAIIEGMNIKVGESRFTLPIMAIQESFRPIENAVFRDTEDNEMIMVRGSCYPVLRLHEFYNIKTEIKTFEEGILIMVEEDGKSSCIFADELIGQQQVVVKSLPEFIKKYKKIQGLGGCTLLGDGNISLILDVGELNLTETSGRKHYE